MTTRDDFLKIDPILPGPFTPEWDSLHTFSCPDWYRDGKFGIWSHWGPQSVPAQGDWYARQMYHQGSPQYQYHLRTYGHPSVFGYKDIIALWKAERFDPGALMKRYVDAGARYFVAQANHHDNFDNWNSKHHRWNSVNMGPRRDIVGEWRKAAGEHGMPFGLSEHLSAAYNWFAPNKFSDTSGPWAGVPYDGNDPAHADLYLPHTADENAEMLRQFRAGIRKPEPWYSVNTRWHATWYRRMVDLLDQHEPDLLYSDGGLPFDPSPATGPQALLGKTISAEELTASTAAGRSIVAHLYNLSARRHGANRAVYNQKDKTPHVARMGIFDIEKGQAEHALPEVWQTDTCIADWFDDVRAPYKSPRQVVETLVDIVSKNGNLLLNIIQAADGSINEEARYILDHVGTWLRINGEGIYGTRPWTVATEGPSRFIQRAKFEEKPVAWTSADFRFTRRGADVFAFQMKYPDERTMYIRALGKQAGKIKAVSLLGHTPALSFRQHEDCLFVQLPETQACEFVPCIQATFE